VLIGLLGISAEEYTLAENALQADPLAAL